MFTLKSKPNPLVTFGTHLAEGLSNRYVEDKELAQRNEEIKKGFESLGENPSRLDILQTIEGLRIPDEQKERLYRGFSDIERDKIGREKEQERQVLEEKRGRQKEDLEEKKAVRAKKLAQTYGISEEESEDLEPADIASLGRHRAKQAPGGLTGQPVPPEVLQKLQQVRSQNPDASAIEFQREADLAGIPRVWSKPEADLLSKRDDIKSQDPYFKSAQQAQAKANVTAYTDIHSRGESAKRNLHAIEGMRKKVHSTGFNLMNSLADITHQEWMRDPDSEQFKTLAKYPILHASDIVKGKVSDYEFRTLGELYASPYKSPEANQALLDYQEYTEKMNLLEATEADKILEENGGITPPDFLQQLRKKTDGPSKKLTEEWRRKKNKSISKIFKRKVVPKGTPVTEEIAETYIYRVQNLHPKMSPKEQLQIAEKMAREDGYEF